MAYMNRSELLAAYPDVAFREAFSQVFSLHWLMSECLLPSGYRPPDELADGICLSRTGEEWADRIARLGSNVSSPEIKLALLTYLFHDDLLIDVTSTNCAALCQTLDAEIREGRVRYPWVYGTALYDRFSTMFHPGIETLTGDDTERLLGGTFQGVFQIRDIIVGPLGIMRSRCYRLLPPHLSIPLWPCSDPSCQHLHSVTLSSAPNATEDVVQLLSLFGETLGRRSEWQGFFLDVSGARGDYYDDMHPGGFPWLLADAFSEREVRCILSEVLRERPRDVREGLSQSEPVAKKLAGSAEEICQRLSAAECFQAMLLVPDAAIMSCLDSLIDSGQVMIPPTEVRTARNYVMPSSWLQPVWQCSRAGVRCVGYDLELALPRLKRILRRLYSDSAGLEQLGWRLRHVEGSSILEKLDRYVHTQDPRTVIGDLIFDSPSHVEQALQALPGRCLGRAPSDDEEGVIDRLAWKLGFNIPLYPSYQAVFWQRLAALRDEAGRFTSSSELGRERMRGLAVNFFVSLEEILDHSLSFFTWALLSDHFFVTDFRCNFDSARRFMASCLHGRSAGSTGTLELDPDGRNTLYPLSQGFRLLADVCDEAIDARDTHKHPQDELPHFCRNTDVQLFPFIHDALLLDVRDNDRDRTLALLRDISGGLERSQACSVRNRMEHMRSDFPDRHEIDQCLRMIEELVSKMEEAGVSPSVYAYAGEECDGYQRTLVRLRRYDGRELTVPGPCDFELCRLPALLGPQIVVPSLHLGDSWEPVRFAFEESSDYVEMWRGYPRRHGHGWAQSVA